MRNQYPRRRTIIAWPLFGLKLITAAALAAPAPEVLVDDLVAHMSLEDKVGQMIQADISSITPADLATYHLGSILAGGGAAPDKDVRTTPQAWLDLTDAFHRASMTPDSGGRRPIPLLFGVDAVHGHAKIVGATIFPHNVALGATHDPELIRRIGEVTAQEVASTGVDWTFAPTVAVARDVRWGRSYESYSENPALVAQYAAAMVTGLQGTIGTAGFLGTGRTLSSVKHFMGDGGTVAGRDQGEVLVSEADLRRIYDAGYPAAIRAGAQIVMASYNSWQGVKLHANHHLLTDVLKGQMGFDGFVVGDWNAHEQIPGCTKYRCAAAIMAGVDMLMAPDSWRLLYQNTLEQVRSGEIPQARVDDAVRRILRVKALAGMLDRSAPRRADAGDFTQLGSAAHRALAREAVRKSLVLLKNNHGTLPLRPGARVLVAGDAADDIGMQTGGWTIDWQGDHNTNEDFPGATSIYAGIKAAVTAGGGAVELSPEGRYSAKPDVALVIFGESPYAEFEGDRETLEFSPTDHRHLELMQRLRAQGVPVVAVFLSGRPMWVNRELNAADAFVAAWLPGSEGAGIADVLFRAPDGAIRHDFTGQLSFSWPQTAMPVTFDNIDHARGALFARGYGLDYQHAVVVPHLAENPRIPRHFSAPDSLFFDAHVTAPWKIFVADEIGEVGLTTESQRSPQGALVTTLQPVGSVTTWAGTHPGELRIVGRAADLGSLAAGGAALTYRYRVDLSPTQTVRLGLRCAAPYLRHPSKSPAGNPSRCGTAAGAVLDVTASFRTSPVGTWNTASVPLSCFTSSGADLSNVEAPFVIGTAGQFGLTIAEVRIVPHAAAASCEGR